MVYEDLNVCLKSGPTFSQSKKWTGTLFSCKNIYQFEITIFHHVCRIKFALKISCLLITYATGDFFFLNTRINRDQPK